MKRSVLTFYGGAGTVTGANFMLDIGTKKVLIDCGMLQEKDAFKSNVKFGYNPKDADVLIVTHSHLDHIGKIPKLVKDGFTGRIISTPATKDLAHPMLDDALKIMTEDAKELGFEPIYNSTDIHNSFSLWETRNYYEEFVIDDVVVRFLDAGHILGSAMIEMSRGEKKFVFTGDLGNTPAPLLRDTDKIVDVDYLLMESVYGDRNHEDRDKRIHKLAEWIDRIKRTGGTLLIPAFSLQRTQSILYELNKLIESGTVPKIPVYLDSPLGSKVTEVFRNYTDLFNDKVKSEISNGDDIFDFPNFKEVTTVKGSVALGHNTEGKILISSSGMSVGGRILSHERTFLQDKKNAILFVGYQAAGTVGRQIQDGNKVVKINDSKVYVRATVDTIRGFSAHKDSNNLVDFVSDSADTLKKVFVTMGEPRSSLFLVQRLREYLGVDAIAPDAGEIITVDF